jgi:hypothetical protein
VPDIAFIGPQNPGWRRVMCEVCAELARQIAHLGVIEQVADIGTRDAARKLIEEKEAQKATLHVGHDDLNRGQETPAGHHV